MRTAEDRIRFKNHFFKLGQGRLIAEDDPFWAVLWTEPDSSGDIYEILTAADARTIRDQNMANFAVLIRRLALKVVQLSENEASFPDPLPLLNCMRFLTKLLPFAYELANYDSEWEQALFWHEFDALEVAKGVFSAIPDKNPLAPALVSALVGLLFTRGFTVEAPKSAKKKSPRHFAVWEPGIGATTKHAVPNLVIESNRTETLRLLLTLVSSCLYKLPSQTVAQGLRFLTVLVAATGRAELLTLVCLLVNVVCRAARSAPGENCLVYADALLTETRHLVVTYSAQLLAVMVVYPLPGAEKTRFLADFALISTPKPCNMARLYLGKLHKEAELLFVASYLISILRQPMDSAHETDAAKFLSTRNTQPSLWATECVILLWELFQCNRSFRAAAGQRYNTELMMVLLYYVFTFSEEASNRNLVRLCLYFLLYLSSDPALTAGLMQPTNQTFYETVPNSYKTSPRPVTGRDFMVIQLCSVLTRSSPKRVSSLISTTLVEILYNIVPISNAKVEGTNLASRKLSNANPGGGLSYAACASLTQLIGAFSTKEFLLEASFHADLLALVLRSVCMAITKNPAASRMLLFSILKNEKAYDQVWSTIYNLNSEFFSGGTLKLNTISDEDVIPGYLADQIITESALESAVGTNLAKTQSRTSELSINSDHSGKNSGRNSVVSIPQTPENEPNELEADAEAIDAALRPRLPTGMSQKAKEKLPRDSPLKRSWGGKDALRIILTIILPHLKMALKEIWSSREGSSVDSFLLIKHIESTDFKKLFCDNERQINYDFLPLVTLEPLRFTWSHLSLGWYTSLLYGNVYSAADRVRAHSSSNKLMKNILSGIASFSKLTSGWAFKSDAYAELPETAIYVNRALSNINPYAQTNVKLFKIDASGGFFRTFAPGGVDMALLLVRRLSDFRVSNSGRQSLPGTPVEEQGEFFGKYTPRNSVTLLHSLNTLNRTRSNTPRNLISM